MPRSIWNGTISLGLIAVPVKVYSAIEDRSVHFHQVHSKDGARIEQKRICSKEHKDVPYKQIAQGYEVRGGEYVLLSKEEIAAAAGNRAHMIEIEEFVSLHQIDPVYYDRAYYLGSGKGGQAAYRLLHDALEKAPRAGLGRWVFHNREYLVGVRALDGLLALHTMRFADELVSPDELDVPLPNRAPGKREVEMAGKLVESLRGPFEPGRFEDSYRQRVLDLIDTKARGEEPVAPETDAQEDAPNLMAALEASLASGSGADPTRSRARGKKPAGKRAKAKR